MLYAVECAKSLFLPHVAMDCIQSAVMLW